ncbi:MAG: 7-cyano-7-deazaguanine synthase [Halioglobus sp.]|jgi:7-cyano-7-deazaguanine synthase
MKKKAIVIHSGGMDSSICLASAINDFQKEEVLSLSFQYGQRHSNELEQARKISREWGVDHVLLSIDCLQEITANALMDSSMEIDKAGESAVPNTLVVGRNGLMARLGAIHAQNLGAHDIYMGVIEVEEANSGYRDCSRLYMDLMEQILRMDLDDPEFTIRTPLVKMTKKETMEFAYKLGLLEYLLEETITCYKGVPHLGCQQCPACELRNEGISQFIAEHPDFSLPKAYSALT